MKRILYGLLCLALLVSGCKDDKYDDSNAWSSIHALEERMKAMETVMNAYKNNLYIQSVTEIDNGYVITFSDGSKATVQNGKDGDTYIQSITIGEEEVTFVLTDGQTFSIPRSSLYISFEEEDLVPVSLNATRDLHYTVKSAVTEIEIEVISSADLKAKVIKDEENPLSGIIRVTTGAVLDEYSKIIVLVSNGEKVIMKRFTFEEARLKVENNAIKNATAEGGEMTLEFLSNVECEVVIPEEAQSWISIIPAARAMEKQTITLKLEPNTGYNRSAVLLVQSGDGSLKLEYRVEQSGDLGANIDPEAVPDDEIWYIMSNNTVYDVFQTTETYGIQPFDRAVISNTYRNGYGVIKFDGPVKKINDHTFGNSWACNMTALYLPDGIEYLGTGAIHNTGLTTFRVPASLKYIGSYGINNQNMSSFTGFHISEDGRCVIIDDGLYAFAPNGLKEYTIPDGVKTIDSYAFSWSNIENVIFNEGLEYIGGDAFCECTKLKSLSLPASLKGIDSYAFRGCTSIEGFYGNEKFHTPDNKCLIFHQDHPFYPEWSGSWICGFAGSGMTEYTIPEGIAGIENYAFQSAKELKSITLTKTIVEVGSYAFYGCSNLETVCGENTSEDHRCIVFGNQLRLFVAQKGISNYVIPEHITSIGYGAFSSCNALESVTMGDNVTEIEGYAFAFCSNLKSVTLSAGLKDISGYNAFLGSSDLESIYLRAPIPPKYSDYQMYDFPLLTIYVPQGSLNLYKSSPDWILWRGYFKGYDYGDLSEFYPDYYVSTDYSQDGKVTTLQTATEGNGIDIVLIGDAYSDRQIADGTYRADMEYIYNNLFTEEPYKSFKHLFNVYYVNVVSATEGYEYGNTALGGFFGDGTLVGGEDEICFAYAQKAIEEERMDEALVIVAMNSDEYAGTCYMYYPTSTTGTYGSGPSVAYFPRGGNASTFAQLLHHEACGHGFSKLDDEYAYEYLGAVPAEWVTDRNKNYTDFGWWKNIDFTNDPATIKWHRFLFDSRYEYDGLGAFEGGSTYWTDVWRPTENSIMRYNTGGFNAPSREAIYYRIHKLAYGTDWEYDYEDFVSYDAINRKTSPQQPVLTYVPKIYRHPHPPIVTGRSWREAK